MSIIKGVIQEELERNYESQEFYAEKIEALPKGSIVQKKVGNNVYCYLKYRDGKKIRSDYLGKPDEVLDYVGKQIKERKQHEQTLKELKSEYKILCKMAKVKG